MTLLRIFIVIFIAIMVLVVYSALVVASRHEQAKQCSSLRSKLDEPSKELTGDDEFNRVYEFKKDCI